jgi:hypothetical protein
LVQSRSTRAKCEPNPQSQRVEVRIPSSLRR